jgi:DNA-binding NarL/FixJ family response regulator
MATIDRQPAVAESATPEERASVPRPRLLIADDNPRVLEQVERMLSAEFDVVARAANGREAIVSAATCAADLLVLDISMPILTGLRAAERLRESGSTVPIVFLTVHDDEEFVSAASAAGGLGYVLKSRMASDLVPAIRAALAGRRFVSSPLAH